MAFIVFGSEHHYGDILTPTGFTVLQADEDVNNMKRASFYKSLAASDISAGEIIVVEDTGSLRRAATALWVFRGAGTPTIKATESTGSGTTVTLNTVTTTKGNFYIGIGGWDDDKLVEVLTYPTTYTDEQFIQGSDRQGTGYSFHLMGAMFQEDIGTTVSGESFVTGNTDDWFGNVYEIPAA